MSATTYSSFADISPVMTMSVMIVSPNHNLRRELAGRLDMNRWQVREAAGGADALCKLADVETQLLLVDPLLPDLEPSDFYELIRSQHPDTQIVTVNSRTGQPLLRSSSPDPLALEISELLEKGGPVRGMGPSNDTVSDQSDNASGLPGMVGNSEVMRKVYKMTRLVARKEATVLILGKSGTGKDLLARAVHLLSPRRSNPFAVINCAAIPEALLEAELFGYAKGSFTGAVQSRTGRIHAAQRGTLFLDEIGEMPLALQAKLLRFLEQGEVQRLGSNDVFRVDVRVVAATNADLRKQVEKGAFREDLFYRLAVFPIELPVLHERMSDLSLLASSFVTRFCPGVVLSDSALAVLHQYNWPGNVRELKNVIERASIVVGDSPEIRAEHIIL